MRILRHAALLWICFGLSVARADDHSPPLSGDRVAGEVLVGVMAGFVGAYLGGTIGGGRRCGDDECITPVVIGAYAGGLTALSAGIYGIGSAGDEHGSYVATLAGAVLAALPTVPLLWTAKTDAEAALLVVAPVAGALVGFNLSRGYDRITVTPTAGGAAAMWSTAW